jgi:GTPase SAR1 family protein
VQWLPEVAHFAPGVPIVLVGTKLDLRADPAVLSRLAKRCVRPGCAVRRLIDVGGRGLDPVSTEQGAAMAKRIRAAAYVECSALTQLGGSAPDGSVLVRKLTYVSFAGVKGVFDAAIRAGRECPLDHWLSTCLTFVSDAPDGHKELY